MRDGVAARRPRWGRSRCAARCTARWRRRRRRPPRRCSLRRLSAARSWIVTTIGQGLCSIAPSIQGEWKTSALLERASAEGRCGLQQLIARRDRVAQRRQQAAGIASDAFWIGHGAAVERDPHARLPAITRSPGRVHRGNTNRFAHGWIELKASMHCWAARGTRGRVLARRAGSSLRRRCPPARPRGALAAAAGGARAIRLRAAQALPARARARRASACWTSAVARAASRPSWRGAGVRGGGGGRRRGAAAPRARARPGARPAAGRRRRSVGARGRELRRGVGGGGDRARGRHRRVAVGGAPRAALGRAACC